MVLIQINVPKELMKKIGIIKLEDEFKTKADVIIDILRKFVLEEEE